jgi:glycosyltransferase involved in cell wall biosynthesis
VSTDAPQVSIVIPAFNHARYLAGAIDSVLAQDYPSVELLVLDDGSTDDTRAVLERYTGRVHWESQPNSGQAATLNRGWGLAAGDLLGYLSADDALLPGAVSRAVAALQADPRLALVYPDYELVDARGRPLRRVRAPEYDYREMVLRWVCPPGPGALFRRAAAGAAGPWDPSLRLSPDYDFWLRLGLHGDGRRIPEVLARFRVHESSQSFAAVPEERSAEYARVTARYFATQPVPADLRARRSEALSNAQLFAARSHLRSGRYRRGLACAVAALAAHPGNARPRAAKILAHGLANHVRYRRAAAP